MSALVGKSELDRRIKTFWGKGNAACLWAVDLHLLVHCEGGICQQEASALRLKSEVPGLSTYLKHEFIPRMDFYFMSAFAQNYSPRYNWLRSILVKIFHRCCLSLKVSKFSPRIHNLIDKCRLETVAWEISA